MKKYNYLFAFMAMGGMFIMNGIISCNKQVVPPTKEIVYVQIKDTILEKQNAIKIKELENKCVILQDSVNMMKDSINMMKDSINTIKHDFAVMKDSINEELFVSKYKFSRIKYYTDIAAKGNNIKFLRGWIYRVLREK